MRTQQRQIKQLKIAVGYATFILASLIVMIAMINSFNTTATACDKALGHTCSLYEVQNYGRGIYGK